MHHPNPTFVQDIINSFLERRSWRPWKLAGIKYEYFPQRYELSFSDGKQTINIQLFTEVIDEYADHKSVSARAKIKQTVRKALKVEDKEE